MNAIHRGRLIYAVCTMYKPIERSFLQCHKTCCIRAPVGSVFGLMQRLPLSKLDCMLLVPVIRFDSV